MNPSNGNPTSDVLPGLASTKSSLDDHPQLRRMKEEKSFMFFDAIPL